MSVLYSISSREASTEPKPLCPVSGEGGGVFTDMSVSPQTDSLIRLLMAVTPLAGTLLAESHVVTFR